MTLRPGATREAVAEVERRLELELPEDYVAFVLEANGGEGPVGEASYLHVYEVERLPEVRAGYELAESVPGYVAFATDLGGESWGWDTRATPWQYVEVPFDWLDWAPVEADAERRLGTTLVEWLEAVAAFAPPA